MKTNLTVSFAVAACLSLCGCLSNTSPVSPTPQAQTTGVGTAATFAGATAVGGLAGYELGHKSIGGAAIGAGAGLLTGIVANNLIQTSKAQHDAELAEAARREERVKIMDEYWEAERMRKQLGDKSAQDNATEVHYPGGYFDGINLAPRAATSADPTADPIR